MKETKEDGKILFIGHLLDNTSIPEKIIDAYYRLQPDQPCNEEEIPKGYVGELHRYNSPYRVCIYGAYPLMIDWQMLQLKIKDNKYKAATAEKYLKLFAKGFKQGYLSFDEDVVKARSSIFTGDSNFAQIVFDYATAQAFGGGNFPETIDSPGHVFSGWLLSGKQAGYFYRAWYIILENHRMFEPLFSVVDNIAAKPNEIKHRHQAIAHEYKVAGGIEEKLSAKAMKAISQRRYEAYLSLYSPKSRTVKYRPATAEELNLVVELLSPWPQAQEKAKEDVKRLLQAQK